MTSVPIHTLDLEYLGRGGSIAAYLLTGPSGHVLIETGPGSTTDALTRGLARHGLEPADIDDVLVTHIHFDHAGAAGWMAQHGATVHVHAFGAKHLIDPSKLMASARRIYGDEMDRRWGAILPIPACQVRALEDGDEVAAAGLRFEVVETPGHARHHHAFVVETSEGRIGFTGDAAGTTVAESPTFMSLPTPPPEFDPEAWHASLDRLRTLELDTIYPTHFGPVSDVGDHLDRVAAAIVAHTDKVRADVERGLDEAAILEGYRAWFVEDATRHGVPAGKMPFYVSDTLPAMNVSGILRYLRTNVTQRRPLKNSGACQIERGFVLIAPAIR